MMHKKEGNTTRKKSAMFCWPPPEGEGGGKREREGGKEEETRGGRGRERRGDLESGFWLV